MCWTSRRASVRSTGLHLPHHHSRAGLQASAAVSVSHSRAGYQASAAVSDLHEFWGSELRSSLLGSKSFTPVPPQPSPLPSDTRCWLIYFNHHHHHWALSWCHPHVSFSTTVVPPPPTTHTVSHRSCHHRHDQANVKMETYTHWNANVSHDFMHMLVYQADGFSFCFLCQ